MVEPHIFLFLGSDELQKQQEIEDLQKKLFPPGLKEFNYAVLYGDEKHLNAKKLKEALRCLPTDGAKKRLVVVRMAHKLNKANQECLLGELPGLRDRMIVVLDVPEVKGSEGFIEKFLRAGGKPIRFKNEVVANVFDLGRSIIGHRPQTALRILSSLLRYREKAEKILGAIFWQWEHSYSEKHLPHVSYKKGLKLILEADKRLKSSSSAYAREVLILEELVVKLAYLR